MGKASGAGYVETSEVNTFQGAADPVFQAKVAGDTYPRVILTAGGTLLIGAGSAAPTAAGAAVIISGAPRSAYTQTFSTADKTHAARTSSAVATDAATDTTPFGFATAAQADALVAAVNAVRADLADTAAALNSVIDDLQALGLVG